MKLMQILTLAAFALVTSAASAADGLIAAKSPYSAKETMDRLEGIVKQRA
jgi:hypothetical protein